jgi:hypothetical protein
VQYISRFCSLHKKSGGGLGAKGSNVVGNDVVGREKKGAEGEGGANDVMIEINRIKNVKFLNFAGFLSLFAQFSSQKKHIVKTK